MLYLAIKEHSIWIKTDGQEGRRADLSEANLSEANLSEANLRRANLIGANLSEADLRWADLSEANLSEANLRRADLRRADLSEANLSEANLSGANLRWADLRKTILAPLLTTGETVEIAGVKYKLFDPRGWVLSGRRVSDQLSFEAGCRYFGKDEALTHWGAADYPNRKLGKQYCEMIIAIAAEFA